MIFSPLIKVLSSWVMRKLSEETYFKYVNDITKSLFDYLGDIVDAIAGNKKGEPRKKAVLMAWRKNREPILMSSFDELVDVCTDQISDEVNREAALAAIEMSREILKNAVLDKLPAEELTT